MKKYILGLVTGLIFIPVIEELLNVALSWIEFLKILPSKLVLKGNKDLAELQDDENNLEEANIIGFQYNPYNEYDDCDDYEE